MGSVGVGFGSGGMGSAGGRGRGGGGGGGGGVGGAKSERMASDVSGRKKENRFGGRERNSWKQVSSNQSKKSIPSLFHQPNVIPKVAQFLVGKLEQDRTTP